MVSENTERRAVEIRWEPGDHHGDVVIKATGAQDDVHTSRAMPNDGLAPVSYPFDFSGSSNIEIVSADDGSVIDSGTINVS